MLSFEVMSKFPNPSVLGAVVKLSILFFGTISLLSACGPGFKAIPPEEPLRVRPEVIKPLAATAEAPPEGPQAPRPPQKSKSRPPSDESLRRRHGPTDPSSRTAPSEIVDAKADSIHRCPESYYSSLQAFETKGAKGWWNGGLVVSALSRLSEGEAIHPRKTCENKNNPLKGLGLHIDDTVKTTAEQMGLEARVLARLDSNCISETAKASSTEDAVWVRNYAVLNLAQRWKSFESAIRDLIELREQFIMVNPDPSLKSLDCEIFKTSNLQNFCKALPNCTSPEQRVKNFEAKAKLMTSIMTGTQSLRHQTQLDPDSKRALDLIESSTLLQGKNLSKIRFQSPSIETVKMALKEDLQQQKKILDDRLTALNQALNCTLGLSEKGCGSVQKELQSLSTDSRPQIPEILSTLNNPQAKAYNEVRRFQQCYIETEENLQDVSKKMNALATAPLMALTPGMALGGLRQLYRSAELGPKLFQSLRLINLAAGAAISVSLEREIMSRCLSLADESSQQSQKLRTDKLARQSALSCSSSAEQFLIAETSSACAIQMAAALIPAGIATREFMSLRGVVTQHILALPAPRLSLPAPK